MLHSPPLVAGRTCLVYARPWPPPGVDACPSCIYPIPFNIIGHPGWPAVRHALHKSLLSSGAVTASMEQREKEHKPQPPRHLQISREQHLQYDFAQSITRQTNPGEVPRLMPPQGRSAFLHFPLLYFAPSYRCFANIRC